MDDHLDKEVSVSAELTEHGIKASAKSRVLAAIDRLGGNLAELINAPMERRISRQRAVTAGERQIIEAATKFGIEKMQHDPEFAQRALEKHLDKVFTRQQNKDAVMREALEDLRHVPPSEVESSSGNENLDDQFLDRLERHAEEASNDKLRQKWGRVLSSEIREPGTFSLKALRIVDEIDHDTAVLFESLCANALRGALPKALVGVLEFSKLNQLVMAGLLVDPGFTGHIVQFRKQKIGDENYWWFHAGKRAIRMPLDLKFTAVSDPNRVAVPIIDNDNVPSVPVYLLTDAGTAIASIFENKESGAFSLLLQKIRNQFPDLEVREYRSSDGKSFNLI